MKSTGTLHIGRIDLVFYCRLGGFFGGGEERVSSNKEKFGGLWVGGKEEDEKGDWR